ncbi:MAG: sporulation protein [Sphingomonas bacterium]|nr:sporulation protein [Sphingomonas bacterium]
MADHKSKDAVAAAEQAVSFNPNNADYRMLLGQSYLSAGRFASAETAFRDTLTLSADQPRAKFDLALAQTAQGKRGEALVVLHGLNGAVPQADLGLALTLAGQHDQGIAMLVDAARSQDSNARTRQNLALAYALDGQWRQSRAVAMQDTPPDRIGDQIAGWAAMSSPQAASGQVAAMLGVTPARDPGQPTALALAAPATPSNVALALAEPEPAASVPVAAPVAGPVAVALAEPAPTMAATPALLAAHPVAAPPLLRASRKPTRVAFAPSMQPIGRGGFVVQLGAYSKVNSLETAWAQASRLSPQVATLSPVRGQFGLSGATLIRLSIGGFANHADASTLCGKIKARGGACFVRATFNDAPLQWAKRDTGTQIASRA